MLPPGMAEGLLPIGSPERLQEGRGGRERKSATHFCRRVAWARGRAHARLVSSRHSVKLQNSNNPLHATRPTLYKVVQTTSGSVVVVVVVWSWLCGRGSVVKIFVALQGAQASPRNKKNMNV